MGCFTHARFNESISARAPPNGDPAHFPKDTFLIHCSLEPHGFQAIMNAECDSVNIRITRCVF
jgi:hypothetical protein